MIRTRVLLCSALAILNSGCNEGTSPESPVASVALSLDSISSVPGAVLQFRVTLRDTADLVLTGERVRWTSTDTTIATIDTTGRISAKQPGSARIIAASGAHADTLLVRLTTITFSSVSTGDFHACGVTTDGALYCWGYGGLGELGIGDTLTASAPVRVLSTLTFSQVGAGLRHTCALTTSGAAYCWGLNNLGQVGVGAAASDPHLVPQAVVGLGTNTALSVGDFHTCVLTNTGAAACWGFGGSGQLGRGNTQLVNPAPVSVTGGLQFSVVSAGQLHSCGVRTDSVGYCWGGPEEWRLGSTCATDLCYASPQPIAGGLKMIAISASEAHSCALADDGKAWCWGVNDNGQLGVSRDTGLTGQPLRVAGGHVFDRIAAGTHHSCGLTSTGAAYCWGANGGGQLGDGTLETRTAPVPVTGGLAFASISAATNYSCGVTTGGRAYCWGTDGEAFGVLGSGGDRTVRIVQSAPTPVLGQTVTIR